MTKAFEIFNNPTSSKIRLSSDEEGLYEEYTGMLRYVLSLNTSQKNVNFACELLLEYFTFFEKKVALYDNIISKNVFEIAKEEYIKILEYPGEYFEKNIFIRNFEKSEYFRGYKKEFIEDLTNTNEEDYVKLNSFGWLV